MSRCGSSQPLPKYTVNEKELSMRINERIFTLEYWYPGILPMNPVLVRGKNGLALIDTGLPGLIEALRDAINYEGFDINDINAVILTHQDLDHIGGVNEIRAAVPGIKVYAHEVEAPYVEGREDPYKLRDKLAVYDSLCDEEKREIDRRVGTAKKYACRVDEILKDNDVLSEFCDMKVIHTPGHTSGHICLYLPADKVIIAGDALPVGSGRPLYNYDITSARESVKKLLAYNIEKMLAYHGGLLPGDVQAVLKANAGE